MSLYHQVANFCTFYVKTFSLRGSNFPSGFLAMFAVTARARKQGFLKLQSKKEILPVGGTAQHRGVQ